MTGYRGDFRAGGGSRWPPVILLPLVAYLAAIMIFGKGPTYLSIGPIYWGELTLALMLGWMYLHMLVRGMPTGFASPLSVAVLCFMALGAALTLRDFPRWGMDALRDAAIWYYGAFFFVGKYIACLRVGGPTTKTQSSPVVVGHEADTDEHRMTQIKTSPPTQAMGKAMPPSLSPSVPALSPADHLWRWLVWAWLAAMLWYISVRMTGAWLVKHGPVVPGRGVFLLYGSGSENYMHMCLGALLLVTGIVGLRQTILRRVLTTLLIVVSTGYLFTCSGRGVKVAVVSAVLAGMLVSLGARKRIWPTGRVFAIGFLLFWLAAVAALLAGPEGLMTASRIYRFEEVIEKATSGTAFWRRLWWGNILEKVHTDNPAFGLGFGYNLSELNPFLTYTLDSTWGVRSPHNVNMTVFGRMGYFGLGLWLAILSLGLGRLFVRVWKGSVRGLSYTLERHKELAFWLMALTAIWVNASFGVLMEGPVLGIPFWFFLGFASGRSLGLDGLEPLQEIESIAHGSDFLDAEQPPRPVSPELTAGEAP